MLNTLTQNACVVCDSRAYGSFEDVTIGDTVHRVCGHCLLDADGPGKFEHVRESDLALALALYALGFDSADYALTDEYAGSVAVFGRYVLREDERGFVELLTFADADKAQTEVNDYENDGFGASEDDAWISSGRNGWDVSFAGEHIGTYERESRARAAVSLAMRKEGYYPNVFLTGEHGPSVRRIDVW